MTLDELKQIAMAFLAKQFTNPVTATPSVLIDAALAITLTNFDAKN